MVDEDIDPSDISQVLWVPGTRVDLDLSIDIVGNGLSGNQNPMLSPESMRLKKLQMWGAIMTVCKPHGWKDEFPRSVEPSLQLAARIRGKWKAVLVGNIG